MRDRLGLLNSVILTCIIVVVPASRAVAVPTDEVINRAAEKPPAQEESFFVEKNEGNEIDLELARYFRSERRTRHSTSKGSDSRVFREGSDGDVEFSNVGSQADSKKDGSGMLSHKVAPGDTIAAIAAKHLVKPEWVMKHNPELGSRPLYIGEEILIVKEAPAPTVPGPQTIYHTVRAGDTLLGVAARYRVAVASLCAWNGLSMRSVIRIGQALKIVTGIRLAPPGYQFRPFFVMPIQGIITSGFGVRWNPFVGAFSQFHRGVDIGANMSTPFGAAADGVVLASARMGGYGNCIFVRHADGYVSVYGHLKLSLVKRGDIVKQGDVIGQVGRTGTATGPHLHFEVRRFTQAINPFAALNLRELVPVKKAEQAVSSRVP